MDGIKNQKSLALICQAFLLRKNNCKKIKIIVKLKHFERQYNHINFHYNNYKQKESKQVTRDKVFVLVVFLFEETLKRKHASKINFLNNERMNPKKAVFKI